MDWTSVVLGLVGGGGLVTGLVALLKVRAEEGQIVVTAAQGALIVQTGVIEQLRMENDSLRTRMGTLESRLGEIATLRERIEELEAQRDRLTTRVEDLERERRALIETNAALRDRVRHLETIVDSQ